MSKKLKLKRVIGIIIVVLAAAAAAGFIVYQSTAPVDTTLQTVEKGTATLSFTEVGDVTATQTRVVHSLSTGKVLSMNVQEGQHVNAGDVICQLDPWEYENLLAQQKREASSQLNDLKIEAIQRNIDNCTITAPISGVITSLQAKDTDLIASEMEVATIASEENKKIEVRVNTTDIAYVSLDMPVDLVLRRRDGDKALTGVVTAIDNLAEVEISAKGNKERLVKVTIQSDQQESLEIGYDVDVQFNYYKEENQLKVPKSAVFEENDKSFVWAVANDKLEKREITIKKTLRSEIVVEKGLSQDEEVVVDALANGLQEGRGVK